MDDWKIDKPLGQCAGTGRNIEPGEEYFAALLEKHDGLQRKDFSSEYWLQNKPDVYCYWKTKLPQAGQKKQIFVDNEMLMTFFERLEKENDQQRLNFRFVIALILMRRRKLKYHATLADGNKEIWRLRIVGGDGEFADVLNPNLDQNQIEQLSAQLGKILHAEI